MFIVGFQPNNSSVDIFQGKLLKLQPPPPLGETIRLKTEGDFFYFCRNPTTKFTVADQGGPMVFTYGLIGDRSAIEFESYFLKLYSPRSKRLDRDLLRTRGSLCLSILDYGARTVSLLRTFPGGSDLYYLYKDGVFIASSHIHPIVCMAAGDLTIDELTTVSVLRFAAPSQTRTLFSEIRRVESGSILQFHPEKTVTIKNDYFISPQNVYQKQTRIKGPDDAKSIWLDSLQRSVGQDTSSNIDKTVVALSGGIDSSLVCALWNEYHDHTINSISFTNSDRPLTRPGAQLTEPAAIEHVSRVLETNHQFVDLADEREGFKLHTRQYARSCFDGIGSSVEYQFFVKQVQGLGFERIITGFNNDGLIGDLPGHDYLTRVLHRKFPQYYRFKIAEMLLERRIIRGAIARLNPSFLQHNEPYAYYGMIETISGNPMLLAQGIDREYLRAANYEYMLPPEELLDQFQDYSAIQHFILADITRIGMGTFQRFNKACTYYDVSWWSPYWDIDVMETALAIPIDYRNKEFSKYIARQLVSDRVSPQIAWLGKSGFARNVINEFFDEWEVYEEIIEGGVLDILPLEGGRRQRLANQIMTKSRSLKKAYWPLYWMTKTIENLKSMIG